MNATQIGAELAQNPSVDDCNRLHREIDSRSSAIQARLDEIRPSASPMSIPHPPERRAALVAGTEAVVALNREVELLRIELDQLEELSFLLMDARDHARTEQARREIPRAVKKLPALSRRVRDALERFESELEELNAALRVIGEYPHLESKALPLTDDELAGLFQLRDAVWQTRRVQIPVPADMMNRRDAWPRSWPLRFEQRRDSVRERRAPGIPYLPDLVPGADEPTPIALPAAAKYL